MCDEEETSHCNWSRNVLLLFCASASLEEPQRPSSSQPEACSIPDWEEDSSQMALRVSSGQGKNVPSQPCLRPD